MPQYKASPAASDGSKIYTYSFHNSTEAEPYSSVSFDHPLVVWNPYNGNTEVDIEDLENETAVNKAIETITNYRISNPIEAAYSRYIAKITIVHSDKIGQPDESAYTQVLTVTQYPQMYITSTANYYNANGATGEQGNTFVNGYKDNNGSGWYNVHGLSSSSSTTNANPNQYVIHVTQLNLGEDYIIGDPRVSEHTDLYGWKTWTTGNFWNPTTHYFGESGAQAPNNNWTEAKDMSGVTRRLTYYYPADESTAKARWIAPAFRVASSYGICDRTNNYAEDKARCAGYQEMSRPAGRWRMPTVAEIEYIMKLSQKGKIPVLFNTNTNYMSAQGRVSTTFVNGKLETPANTNNNAAVRCVYDEWYWGNDTITPDSDGKYVFTWGDRPRSAPQ